MNAMSHAKPKPVRAPWTLTEILFLCAFVFWSAAGLIFTIEHISPGMVARWHIPQLLRDFVGLCIQWGDPLLILLASINTHLHTARQWSGSVARRWGLIILLCAYAVEAVGVKVGLPFGVYHYTGNFGPMIGPVPLTIPLAWHVVVTNSLFCVRAVAPYLSRLTEAAAVGLLCTVYDYLLEPFATTFKHYWVWADKSVPPINYAAWFILSALLVRLFAPTISTRNRLDPRPVMILLLTVLIFIAGEWKP